MLLFETGFHHVALAGLELTTIDHAGLKITESHLPLSAGTPAFALMLKEILYRRTPVKCLLRVRENTTER